MKGQVVANFITELTESQDEPNLGAQEANTEMITAEEPANSSQTETST